MTNINKFHPVIENLVKLIEENNWNERFDEAIKSANNKNVPLIERVTNLDSYLKWINDFLFWVPFENRQGDIINDHLSAFYFIADQKPLLALQNRVIPHDKPVVLSAFSNWLVEYANVIGEFLDTSDSLTEITEKTFYDSPVYNMNEYLRPRGGWKSFNQIFARNFKPGYRPIAGIADNNTIVMPADSTYVGQWEIRTDSNITVKNLNWTVLELLDESPYRDRFKNGIFMHSYLSPADYHRQHAPLSGKVLEARIIHGQVYLDVEATSVEEKHSRSSLKLKRKYNAHDDTGYQFLQSRGLIVLETKVGLVAILPIGMCQVSSVMITAEVGVTLRKGEEISYFQFGGSDIIMVFEASSNVMLTAQPNVHYKMGTKIGEANPVL